MDAQQALSVKMLFSVADEFSKTPAQSKRKNLCSTVVAPQLAYLSLSLPEIADGLRSFSESVGTGRCHLLGFRCPIREETGHCEGKDAISPVEKRRLSDKLLQAHQAACEAGKEDVATLLFQALELELADKGDSRGGRGEWEKTIWLHRQTFEGLT